MTNKNEEIQSTTKHHGSQFSPVGGDLEGTSTPPLLGEVERGLPLLNQYFSEFTETQQQQFAGLEAVYREWNEKINVISRKDIDSLYLKHVLHSLAIAAVFTFEPGSQVIDIGCGGGFPGVPLAIFFPKVHFHMVDSIGKKLKVVEAVAEAVDLQNVTVQHIRAEEIKNRKFDVAVSRAVAPLKDLLHWSQAVLNKKSKVKNQEDGQESASGLICLKGGDLASEISESRAKPRVWDIHSLFREDFFEGKYVLQVG
jgi:16S rRNA (guanine527-N7)-methyltransferase